ncbi:hypothetical protein AB0F30_33850 [Streptomyces sp. NPDC029006]|uniref:phenylacetate--CoA ligase family protein n=1 Tax=Streptomyces sp. NPDC029006 TaxID=3155467 RepID=UPI0033DC5F7B
MKEDPRSQLRLRRKWEHERQRLQGRYRLAPEERTAWQLERVRCLVDSAFATVPFYRRLYSAVGFEPGDLVTWSDFEKLPLVNKRMLVEAGMGEEVAGHADGRTVHSARTSGSSGYNITIYQDNASVDYRTLLHMRHCEMGLSGPLKPDDWRYSVYFVAERFTSLAGGYPFVTVSLDCPPRLVLEHLAELRPRLMAALPSYLQRLAAENVALDAFGLEAAYTNSERSSREERVKYSEVFRVPVLDEYSSEELSLIACECPERSYHVVEDSVYLEVTDADQDGFGRLVGTSLGNFLMPFIRYDQGDIARLSDTDTRCGCGSRFRTITQFRGREDEYLRDGPSRTVPADIVLNLCDRTLVLEASNVRQYQIVQVAPARIQLRVQPVDPAGAVEGNPVVAEFVRELPGLFRTVRPDVEVVRADDFSPFASGKRRLIHLEGAWAGRPGEPDLSGR